MCVFLMKQNNFKMSTDDRPVVDDVKAINKVCK